MRLLIIGAGGVTRDLLRGLGEQWTVTVVDIDSQRLALAARIRPITTVVGDGSSRVVLESAGLDDALVAATNNDAVNQEACRLAKEAGVSRVVSVAADPENLATYRTLGVPAFSPDRQTARRIEINLEPHRVSSAAFADGMAEAAEFKLGADSPLVGRSLAELHTETSLIAAILRNGELIIPHGSTVLQGGDLVTVVGAAADYGDIVRSFTAGTARFPAEYGRQVALVVDSEWDLSELLPEAVQMTRNSAAESVLVLHRRLETMQDKPQMQELAGLLDRVPDYTDEVHVQMRAMERGQSVRSIVSAESVGLVVLRAPVGGWLARRWGLLRLSRRMRGIDKPVLLAVGRTPYRHIVVEVSTEGAAAGRAAIDLTVFGNTRLIAVAAVPPAFMVGEEALETASHSIVRLREEAAIKGVTVRGQVRHGNPVRSILDSVQAEGLLVVPMPNRLPTIFNPGLVGLLIARSETSVLLVPERPIRGDRA